MRVVIKGQRGRWSSWVFGNGGERGKLKILGLGKSL